MGKQRTSLIILLILCFAIVSISEIPIMKAESTIYIRADGSVEGTDKIQRDGNVYTFLGDISIDVSGIDGIIIERDNIVIDGAGYRIVHLEEPTAVTSEDGILVDGRSNVTITNVTVENFLIGISVTGSSNIIITKTNITNNYDGIQLSASHNNSIIDNQIVNNQGYPLSSGINLGYSENNKNSS